MERWNKELNAMWISRSVAGAVLIGSMTALYAPASCALPASQVAELAKNSTVAIRTARSIGSGVLIQQQGNRYTVLTAAHVVRDREAQYQISTVDDRQYALDLSTVKVLPGADLALLTFVSDRKYAVLKVASSASIGAGTTVYVGGFPLKTAAISQSIFNFTEGKVTASSRQPLADGYGLIYTNLTLPGMSGGSVLNESGELIAIHGKGDVAATVSAASPQVRIKTGFNLGIPADTFIPLVRQAGVNLVVATATARPIAADDSDFVAATVKLQSGDYNGALGLLDRFIEKEPRRSDAYYLRASVYQVLGNRPQALENLHRVIALDAKNANAYLTRASMLLANQDSAGAIADYDRVIQLEPRYTQSYIMKAMAQEQLGDLGAVLNTYNALIAANPQEILAYESRAGVKVRLNDFPGAIADYTQVIRLEPKNINAYQNRAHFRKYSGDPAGAIADYTAIIKISPNNINSYEARAGLLKDQGNLPAALADYGTMLKINPRNFAAYSGQLEIHQQQKNNPGIVAALTGILALYPTNPAYYFLRGDAQMESGNKAQALSDYRRALEIYRQQKDQSQIERMTEKIRALGG
jgi:tetratricopeptide (TPR) repeat protein